MVFLFLAQVSATLPDPEFFLECKSECTTDSTNNYSPTTANPPTCDGTSCNFDGINDYVNTSVQTAFEGATYATCSYWISAADLVSSNIFDWQIGIARTADGTNAFGAFWDGNPDVAVYGQVRDSVPNAVSVSIATPAYAALTHHVLKYNTTAVYLWEDGTLTKGGVAVGDISTSLRNMFIGAFYDGTYKYWWDGDMTQIQCWVGADANSIGQEEVDEIGTAGASATYDDFYPSNTVTITTPTNSSDYFTNVTYLIYDDTKTYIDTWVTMPNSSVYYFNATNNTDVVFPFTLTTEGLYFVNVTADLTGGNSTDTVYFTQNLADLESDGFDKNNYISGEAWNFYQYIRVYLPATNWTNYLTFNSTNYTLSFVTSNSTHRIYGTSGTMPVVTSTEVLPFNSTFENEYVAQESSTRTIELGEFALDDCSSYSYKAMTFVGKDEVTLANQTYTLNGAFTVTPGTGSTVSQTFNFSFTGGHEYSICLRDNNVTYILDAEMEYLNGTYETRNYYVVNTEIDATEQVIDLYLIEATSDAKQIILTIQDENGLDETGVIVYLNKYIYDENVYRTVAMAKSDDLGTASSYIFAPDNLYQFILIQNTTVVNTYNSINPIPDATTDVIELLLLTESESFGEYWSYFDTIASTCIFTNSTKNLNCTYADTSGLLQAIYFSVEKKGYLTTSNTCSESLNSASGSFSCNLGTNATNEYTYSLVGEFASSNATLQSGSITVTIPTAYGDDGYLAAMTVIGILGTSMMVPEVALFLSLIGIIVSTMMGLIYVSLASLAGLAVSVVLIINSTRRK